MGPLFQSLVEDSVAEIERREPEYFQRFPLTFPRGQLRLDRYRQHPSMRRYADSALDRATDAAAERLEQRGVPVAYSDEIDDPASLVLFDAALDAFAAKEQLLPIRNAPRADAAIDEILGTGYDEHRTASGRRYLVSRRGTQPLLVISALGIPIAIWKKLLSDTSHDFRIVTVENRCGDLISGGMDSDVDLTRHADDIAEVLDQEQPGPLHVLGWCNGGRIAIDLVTRGRYNIRSLTLLSPTLRGTENASKPGSPFEDRLQQIFATITRNQALAMPLVKMLARFTQPPDWDGLAGNASARAAALFALPSRESAATFLVPMSTPPLLINYARRTAADEAYPMADTLRRLGTAGIPVLLISGSHDSMVSNQATCTALANGGVAVTHAQVAGAGHYIQDLQYPYFLWLLRSFADNHNLPNAALRVDIQHSNQSDSVQLSHATTT
ncbi:MAG: alpha/beta hydrolase [Acidobacteriia bacterium]|nr:alpha/beta hydrolase [Terriglobia bacterium]